MEGRHSLTVPNDNKKTQILSKLVKRSKIDYDTGCFLYLGRLYLGYGCLSIGHSNDIRVHRLSAWIFKGMPLNSEMNVNHQKHCPNKNCWAPNHIYIGTNKQNRQDCADSQTYCVNGHEFTPENTRIYYRDNGSVNRICKECSRQRVRQTRALDKFYGT
jgi:hypothetical protein